MRKTIPILAATLLLVPSLALMGESRIGEELSFEKLAACAPADIGPPLFFASTDGTKLAYYACQPPEGPVAAMVFLHGGGAYSEAGYQGLATTLAEKYHVSVYLLDLRGHGHSGGERGDAPLVTQVWKDLASFIGFVKHQNATVPLYLGGHSSGGGLLLNYDSWHDDDNVAGYVLISPELGYKSGTARTEDNGTAADEPKAASNSFVRVDIGPFVLRSTTFGLLGGHSPAVHFNYLERVRAEKPLLLSYITCNMSLSMTPDNPQKQFRNIHKPFYLCIGSDDELYSPDKVLLYADTVSPEIRRRSQDEVVDGETHLSILTRAGDMVGKWIENSREEAK